jgi:hypothetical protein
MSKFCCSLYFDDASSYIKHLQSHKNNTKLCVTCNKCGYNSKCWYNFKTHYIKEHAEDLDSILLEDQDISENLVFENETQSPSNLKFLNE